MRNTKLSRSLALLASACLSTAALTACGENSVISSAPADSTTSAGGNVPVDTSTTDTNGVTPVVVGRKIGYYAAPSGSSTADGSYDRPWDLATAIAGGNGRIAAGDTVWMRAGTYRGNFIANKGGQPGKPITFRQYPGERATIDGTLRVNAPDMWFWGFEIMRSTPNDRLPALEARGARQKYINLVIHDAAQQGITFWDEAIDAVVYGCLVYNNGTHENLDHGTYVHNMSGTKLIKDNVFFNNLAYGIHVYAGPNDGMQRNVHVIGNVSFDNGTISRNYLAKGNIIIGDEAGDEGMRAQDNLLYFAGGEGENMRLGYTALNNRDVIATGNYVVGGRTALVMGQWSSATVQNNTLAGPSEMVSLLNPATGLSFAGNTYYRDANAAAWRTTAGAQSFSAWRAVTGLASTDQATATTSTTKVFVKKNDYEGGRGTVVVYNFGHQSSVTVDISGLGLWNGARYEVRNVQDFYGTPVVSGTYNGGTITLPMTGVPAPTPIGRATGQAPRTGPNFDTFVIVTR